MDDQCKAALELLVQNGYLEAVKGKYRATAKLNDALKEPVIECMVVINGDNDVFQGKWQDLYVKFITDCKVPSKGENSEGDLYDLNKYTEDAMKHFRDLIRSGIQYPLLVQVTTAYYQTGTNRYKKKVGNYITEGHWRMDYLTLKDQDPKQRLQTLKQETDAAKPFTRDRIG